MNLKLNKDYIAVFHGDSKPDYIKEAIKYYSKYKDFIIWSTWKDTPPQTVELLENLGFRYILNDYPENIGMSYQNYQKMGFLHGLNLAKTFNIKYIYKIRNDLIFSNFDKLLDYLQYKIETGNKPIQALCWDNLCNGICDYGMFGEINELEFYWSVPEKYLYEPGERVFIKQYFIRKGINYNFTFDSAKQLIDTYINDLEKLGVNINRYKWIEESPLQEHFANRVIYR